MEYRLMPNEGWPRVGIEQAHVGREECCLACLLKLGLELGDANDLVRREHVLRWDRYAGSGHVDAHPLLDEVKIDLHTQSCHGQQSALLRQL
jgi:hypothetical protein